MHRPTSHAFLPVLALAAGTLVGWNLTAEQAQSLTIIPALAGIVGTAIYVRHRARQAAARRAQAHAVRAIIASSRYDDDHPDAARHLRDARAARAARRTA